MYQQNQSDMFTNAVEVELAATLSNVTIPAARFAAGANTSANITANASAVAYPSIGAAAGGTFLGSARPSVRGVGTGEQNDRIGVSYTLVADANGIITSITPVQTRRNGNIQGAVTSAPLNPGVGPNIGLGTIIFDTACLIQAFGALTPAITGSVTCTMVAGDFQVPRSGTVAGAVESVYEFDSRSGGDSFGVWIGVAGTIKLELAGAPANQFVTITAPVGPMDLQARKIYIGANTTATGILALY
jgi:hypothetical protein